LLQEQKENIEQTSNAFCWGENHVSDRSRGGGACVGVGLCLDDVFGGAPGDSLIRDRVGDPPSPLFTVDLRWERPALGLSGWCGV
jgi:hypothetical protein